MISEQTSAMVGRHSQRNSNDLCPTLPRWTTITPLHDYNATKVISVGDRMQAPDMHSFARSNGTMFVSGE